MSAKWFVAAVLVVCLQSILWHSAVAATSHDISVDDVNLQTKGILNTPKCLAKVAREVVRLVLSTPVDIAYCPHYVLHNLKYAKDDVLWTLVSVRHELYSLLHNISMCPLDHPVQGLYCVIKEIKQSKPKIAFDPTDKGFRCKRESVTRRDCCFRGTLAETAGAFRKLVVQILKVPQNTAFCSFQMVALHFGAIQRSIAKFPKCLNQTN